MKAIVWTKYGSPDVLQLREVEKPIPKAKELLVKIYATTVTAGDCEARCTKELSPALITMRMYTGLFKPTRIKILGQEIAGEVEAVGKDVTLFKEGDQVFASTGFRLGAYAEYTCVAEDVMVALKPANVSFEEAAAVPLGGLEAWHYVGKANIRNGQKVLINGAGGSIGTIAVQLAKLRGAEVTAVDSTGKLDMLRSIGADHVIDFMKQDFTKNHQSYDVILDVPGKSSHSRCKGSLKENGHYLSANPGFLEQLRGIWKMITRRKQVVAEFVSRRNKDLLSLRELLAAGKIKTVIDRRYPLEQTAEAHRYVETGQKRGNVIITVAHGTEA